MPFLGTVLRECRVLPILIDRTLIMLDFFFITVEMNDDFQNTLTLLKHTLVDTNQMNESTGCGIY